MTRDKETAIVIGVILYLLWKWQESTTVNIPVMQTCFDPATNQVIEVSASGGTCEQQGYQTQF